MRGINHYYTQKRLLSTGGNLYILTRRHGHFTSSRICNKTSSSNSEWITQPNEAVSKIEQKTSSRNQRAKCFRFDNCTIRNRIPIHWQKYVFSKIRDTHRKLAENKPHHFSQCSFRNYPFQEFRGWFVSNIYLLQMSCHQLLY